MVGEGEARMHVLVSLADGEQDAEDHGAQKPEHEAATAALGDDSDPPASTYNTSTAGLVDNDASATAIPQDGGTTVVGTDDDQVQIIDEPITQTTEKDWLGGPVAIPSAGTPANEYPRSRLRIRTTNTTPAKVDQLQITDPAPGSTTPGTSP